jgi:hypothetical protein
LGNMALEEISDAGVWGTWLSTYDVGEERSGRLLIGMK